MDRVCHPSSLLLLHGLLLPRGWKATGVPWILFRHADGEGAAPTSDVVAASSDTCLRRWLRRWWSYRTQHRVQRRPSSTDSATLSTGSQRPWSVLWEQGGQAVEPVVDDGSGTCQVAQDVATGSSSRFTSSKPKTYVQYQHHEKIVEVVQTMPPKRIVDAPVHQRQEGIVNVALHTVGASFRGVDCGHRCAVSPRGNRGSCAAYTTETCLLRSTRSSER